MNRTHQHSARASHTQPPSIAAIGAVLIGSGIFHFGVFVLLSGPLDGPVSWRKPATFGLSFGLTLITISWVASYLTLSPRARSWLLGVFAADCVLEVASITVQAWRHVPSHFDTETPLNTVIAMNLAVGGAVLIAVLGTSPPPRSGAESTPHRTCGWRCGPDSRC